MPKPQPSEPSVPEDYTSGMRVFGGFAWATILTGVVGALLVTIPQYPRPWLWVVLPLWLGLGALGITLQWSVARGACPKCGYHLIVPAMGKRCPQCRSYLKAVNRTIVKV
jgi:hypothetical protein